MNHWLKQRYVRQLDIASSFIKKIDSDISITRDSSLCKLASIYHKDQLLYVLVRRKNQEWKVQDWKVSHISSFVTLPPFGTALFWVDLEYITQSKIDPNKDWPTQVGLRPTK